MIISITFIVLYFTIYLKYLPKIDHTGEVWILWYTVRGDSQEEDHREYIELF